MTLHFNGLVRKVESKESVIVIVVEMHLIRASWLFDECNVTCLDIEAHFQLQIIMLKIVFYLLSLLSLQGGGWVWSGQGFWQIRNCMWAEENYTSQLITYML